MPNHHASAVLGPASALALAAGVVLAGSLAAPAPAFALEPVNPVRISESSPANSGFLVVVEGDTTLSADETEGSVATGGNLSYTTSYNLGVAGPLQTPTAPGDPAPVVLWVGGGIIWPETGAILSVQAGTTKVADTSTYSAYDTDTNGAAVNYRLTEPGAAYESTPHIAGTVRQTPASIANVNGIIDLGSAFSQYRVLTQEMGACTPNLPVRTANGEDLARPLPAGANAYITLTAGVTNVLNLSAEELAGLSGITFNNLPSADTPLLINVFGTTFAGTTPNLAGISRDVAPYILWNFPEAQTITATGGSSLQGTLYAPNADVAWTTTQNLEGNLIAANLTHGVSTSGTSPREIHNEAFATTLDCVTGPAPEPTPSTPEPSPSPSCPSPTSVQPTPGEEPTPTPSVPGPEPTPTPSVPGPEPTGPGPEPTGAQPTADGGGGCPEAQKPTLPATGAHSMPLFLVAGALIVSGSAGIYTALRTRKRG